MATISEEDIPMAQCGACDSIIPLDSESCPECGVRFGGVTEQELGECGACQSIIPADSTSCPNCGAVFVETEAPSSAVEPETSLGQIDPEEIPTDDSIEGVVDEVIDTDDENQEPQEEIPEIETVQEEVVTEHEPEATEDSNVVEEAEVPASVEEDTETEEEGEAAVSIENETEKEEIEVTPAIKEVDETEEVADEIEDLAAEVMEKTEEDDSEITIDDLVDDLETESIEDDVEEEVEDSEEEVEDTEEEKEPEAQIEDSEIVMAFENLALAIAAKGMTAAEAFGEMDSSDDNLIDAPELQKGIEKIAGEKLIPKHVTAILNYLDKDGDRRVDPNELVNALEDLRIGIQPGNLPKVKTFPSPLQKFLMGKKANDIVYPIAYFLMVTFIGLWVVNGMGLLVDGSGGTVVYDGGTDQWGGEITQANWNLCQSDAFDEMIDPCKGTVSVGETYPCDPALDPNKCQNSLTPFSGTNGASSMPAGFYGDGIFMIILGVIGLAVTAYLHLIYAPSLRDRAKKGDSVEDDETESEEDDESAEESEEYEDEEDGGVLEAPTDLEIEESDDEEDEDEEYDDEDIDVGDWVGLEIDGEEFFGEIVEFDDDEGTVTIETDEGEEVTGDQEDMFLDDE